MNDFPRAEFDPGDAHLARVRDFYESPGAGQVGWAAAAYRQTLARYYTLMFPADASVLEVGCGGGDLLALLPNRDVTGVDLSSAQIDAARRRLPHGGSRCRPENAFRSTAPST